MPGVYRYRISVDINQLLAGGEIEQALVLGIRAMHEARGEVANFIDGVQHRGVREGKLGVGS